MNFIRIGTKLFRISIICLSQYLQVS